MQERRPDSPLVARVVPSPNHGPRLRAGGPDAVILHYTGMRDGPSAIQWLCEPRSEVSCHYVVEEDGTILQLVSEDRRAWHAGRSSWRGEGDLNSASIGIEIVNGGHDFGLPPFPPAQVAAVAALCRDVAARHGIPPDRVLAHSDVAPGRKRDPGERFPWDAIGAAAFGVAPPETFQAWGSAVAEDGPEVEALQLKLAEVGYAVEPSGHYDAATRTVVEAFQRRHRRDRVDGLADRGTMAALDAVIAALRALRDRGAHVRGPA